MSEQSLNLMQCLITFSSNAENVIDTMGPGTLRSIIVLYIIKWKSYSDEFCTNLQRWNK